MKRIATRLAKRLAHHVIGPAGVAAVCQPLQSPHALLLCAVRVAEVFVQHAVIALPGAVHDHGEALDDLARAVGENAIGVQHAVEIAAQVQRGFLAGIVGNFLGAAA